ncbi:hypothetical protein GCM10022242_19680 [Nocardioides panacisoli]|uniref:Uncharacterized protein n=1 Tax=Nocardioides panacisoli TaxID=627624 RepID=A0ABP7IGB6_9ACTN
MSGVARRQVGALHTAYFHTMAGLGLLLLPNPETDVWLSGSLHGADFDGSLLVSRALGWVPLLDEDGLFIEEGTTADGGLAIALAAEGIVSRPTIPEMVGARAALLTAARVMPSVLPHRAAGA